MKSATKFVTLGAIAGGGAAVIGAGVAAYAFAVRPRIIRWGATDEEVRRVLPGDSLVEKPRIAVTHAITVDAPPEKVWPWLAQLGKGRGGFYSYEFIENQLLGLDIHNADTILPEHQQVKAGDRILFAQGVAPEVVILQQNRMLVMHGDSRIAKPGDAPRMSPGDYVNVSWGFYIGPLEDKTRLIERMRIDYNPNLVNNVFYGVLLEPGSFVMERQMLIGIKLRAEGRLNGKPERRRFEFRRPDFAFNMKPIQIDRPGAVPPPAHGPVREEPVSVN